MEIEDIKSEDKLKIKTLCEYLLFDQFQDTATFPRFEQCFQPLFNNVTLSMETVFKDICGEKKKYINYKRFARAYINHLNGKDPSQDTATFFSTLLSKILKDENQTIGETIENNYIFSTVKTCKKRQCITLVEILSDKQGKIHGINLEYDGVFKSKMYPSKIEDELVVSLEMTLGIVDEKPITDNELGKFLGIKQGNYRDSVTHIFGTINQENGLITFLGFKCVSGKTVFVGFPEGDGFLFGRFGKKFHDLKIQMTVDGINKLQPGFKINPRKNFFLEEIAEKLNNQDLYTDELIKDEEQLANLNDDVAIDKLITTPIVEDDHFFNTKLKDEITGNDYKEVVNQHPRNWILRGARKKKATQRRPMTLQDALKGFNEEHENRAPSRLRARRLRSNPHTYENTGGEMVGSGRRGKMLRAHGPMGGPMAHGPMGGFGMPMGGPGMPMGGPMGGPGMPMGGPMGGPGMPMGGPMGGPGMPPFAPWLHKTKAFRPRPRPGMPGMFGAPQMNLTNQRTKLRNRRKKNRWNGKIEKRTPPSIFLNRENYKGLKDKLGQLIRDEVTERSKGDEVMKQSILSQIIPDPGNNYGRLRGKKKTLNLKNNKRAAPRLRMKNLKGESRILGQEKPAGTKLRTKPSKSAGNRLRGKKDESKVVYSDALQFLNDMSDKTEDQSNNNVDNLFGFGGNNGYNNNYDPYGNGYNNYGYGYNNFRNYNNYGNYNNYNNYNNYQSHMVIPPAGSIPASIPASIPPSGSQQYNNYNQNQYGNPQYGQYNQYGQPQYGQYNQYGQPQYGQYNQNDQQQFNQSQQTQEEEEDPERIKAAQEKWKNFRKGLEKINGVYLLQTIGSIIKAMKLLEGNIEGSSSIPFAEQVKLYKMIEENEAIVDFLSQDPSPSYTEGETVEISCGEEDDDDDEEDNILIPDEHPEQFTNLEELEEKLEGIKQLLENKNLKEEDRKKVEQLHNLYLQQKNILIENETKTAKTEVISQNNINVNKYLQEEQEKRRKAQEEEQKRIEQMRKEEEAKRKKNEEIQSILNQKVSTKVYRDQKMPTGDEPWTDDIFPPEKKSLCPFDSKGWVLPEDVWESDVEGWEKFKWCRVEEIFDSKDYSLFIEGSSIDDIQQGNIGDCYFLSVLGSLCAFPDFFDKLFHIKEKTKEHVYGVYLYINGKWELVLVDDYFPYEGLGFKQFAFSCSAENEIWVPLIEKAWAKVNGCYAKIGCGGLPNEVFDVLTEAFSEQKAISKSNKEEIWKKCEDAAGKGYVMTAGTSGDVSNLDLEEVGLSPGHAYSFLNIYKVDTGNGIERVVKLRNPWGNGEYNGAWSDSSKKWTASTKKQCGYTDDNDDGVFYMSFDDFVKYYVTMGIAKLEHGYKTTVCKIGKEKAVKCQVIKLTVNEENPKSYIQLYQKNPRIILKDGTYQSTVLSFIMLVDENFKYIKSVASTDMHIGIEEDLKPGTYFVLCDVNYRYVNENGKNHGFNVTCYSKNPIILDNVTERIDTARALEVAMYYYCQQKVDKCTKDKCGIQVYISKNYNSELPFMLACFVNPTPTNFKIKLEVKGKGSSKTYCIYNDNTATENDTSVIKELKSGTAVTISILKYSLSSMFSLAYTVLSQNDTRTTENTNPVFDTEGEQIDEDGNLFQYIMEVNDGNGYTIGLENTSGNKIKLKLILEGLTAADAEYKGQANPMFESLPNSKKVFNLRVKPNAEDLSFEFTYA